MSSCLRVKKFWIASSLALLAMTMVGCSGYKTPGSSNPASMSADTLCYRYAYARHNRALQEEIATRNLDCEEILDSQPAMGDSRY